jgi:hypothetical protein
MGVEAELSFFSQGRWAFSPQDSLPTIQRYNTANRRALLKNLELLEKLCPTSESSEPAVADFDQPDVGSSEEWTDPTEPPLIDGDPED